MHVEKNVCESLVGTLLNVPVKTKDGMNARLDLAELGIKLELFARKEEDKTTLPPTGYTLTNAKKDIFCETLSNIRVPQGYCSNFSSLVSLKDRKLIGFKSHDYRMLMQEKEISLQELDKMQLELIVTLCLLEKFFPLNRPEGCIAEDTSAEETIEFFSEYHKTMKTIGIPPDKHVERELVISKDSVSKTIRWISYGPRATIVKYEAYNINGYTFRTKSNDGIVYQNSGVSVEAVDLHISKEVATTRKAFYYGVLQEIWVLDYRFRQIPLFKCDWVNHKAGGVKHDPNLGYTLVAYLSKSDASEWFDQILDFLNVSTIRYALTVNPTIYVSCIKKFWSTAKVKIVNGVVQLQALTYGKKVFVSEAIIRRDIHLEDAEGVECLPNNEIFEELARMGYEKPPPKLTFYKAFFAPQWKFLIHTLIQCLSAKRTAWNEFSSTMASAVICLATGKKFNFSKYIFDSMVRNVENEDVEMLIDEEKPAITSAPSTSEPQDQPSKPHDSPEQEPTHLSHHDSPLTSVNPPRSEEGSLQLAELMALCTSLQRKVDALEKNKLAQATDILSLKKRVEKLEKRIKSKPLVLRRLRKIGSTTRVESSEEASLGAEENASKQGGMISDIDADVEISLVDETHRLDDDLIFDTTADLGGEEVVVKLAETGVSAALDVEVSAAEPAVTTVSSLVTTDSVTITAVEPVSAATKELTDNDMTMAEALVELNISKPKVVIIVPILNSTTTVTTTKPKAKGIKRLQLHRK
ncbi:hypothetical protein Tco_0410030 [Tanacetum coccineum]